MLKSILPDPLVSTVKWNLLLWRDNYYRLSPAGMDRATAVVHTLLTECGDAQSCEASACVDSTGSPIPMYSYAATEFLSRLDFQTKRVYEFGAGNSTVWWGRRAEHVVSAEGIPQWAERVRAAAPSNCEVYIHDGASMDQAIAPFGRFDVIIVDHGRWRLECCQEAVKHLKHGGMIILDDSDRLPRSCRLFRGLGFTQMDFVGLTPSYAYVGATSIFFKEPFAFQRLPDRFPLGIWEPEEQVHKAAAAGR